MAPRSLSPLFRRAVLPALCLLAILYFGAHALVGEAGVLALDDIRREQAEGLERKARLEAERAALQRDIALLDPGGADPDFADELVRRNLGVVRPDEVIVPLQPRSAG